MVFTTWTSPAGSMRTGLISIILLAGRSEDAKTPRPDQAIRSSTWTILARSFIPFGVLEIIIRPSALIKRTASASGNNRPDILDLVPLTE